jgi:hypothetical protein
MKRESAEDLHHPRATRDPRSVPVVFIVTGLTHSANMADNSTEMHEKPLDLRHQEKREASLGGSSTSPIPPTKPSEVSGIWGYFARMEIRQEGIGREGSRLHHWDLRIMRLPHVQL